MLKAVDRDPRAWDYHYGLAVARAAAGRDPRMEARTAYRLNPRHPRTLKLVRRFDASRPRAWKALGRKVADGIISL